MSTVVHRVGFRPGFLKYYITECCNARHTTLVSGEHVCKDCNRNVEVELFLYTKATLQIEANKQNNF